MSRRRAERKKRNNELLEKEKDLNEHHEKIIKLKQQKTTSKGLFTRTKHKLTAILDNERDVIDGRKLKELKNELSELQRKIMEPLSELSSEYGKIKEFEKQNSTLNEIEKIYEDFNDVMTEVKEHLQSTRSERMTQSSRSLRSYGGRSRIQDNNKDKEDELRRKQVETELRRREKELDEMYQKKKSKINEAIEANTMVASLRDEKSVSKENNSSADEFPDQHSVHSELNNTAKWVQQSKENLMKGFQYQEEPDETKINKDLWKQLKRVSIPVFNGDKRQYDNWKSAFMACIDKAPATPEYKLLQLRQYLSGEALQTIETLGHSSFAYEAAKERLERKFGVQRRKIMLFMDELDNFKPVRLDHPKDIEKFADLLDIAVINLQEAKRDEELGNGTFYRKLQRKLPERLLTQYQRWIFENKVTEGVKSLRRFVVQEAEFQVTAAEVLFLFK